MSIAAIALLIALGGPVQDQTAPRVETRSEIRVVRAGGPDGPGRLDADGNGVVTREEFTAPLTSAFDSLDTNGDGVLSAEELAARSGQGSTQVFTHIVPGRDGAAGVAILGGPGGAVSRGDVIAIRRGDSEGSAVSLGSGSQIFVRRVGPGGEATPDAAAVLDGLEGAISRGEAITIVRGGREGAALPLGSGSQVFVRRFGPNGEGDMDKDGDGKVSEEEFLAPLRDAFRRLDANASGFLDEGESAASPPAPPAPPSR